MIITEMRSGTNLSRQHGQQRCWGQEQERWEIRARSLLDSTLSERRASRWFHRDTGCQAKIPGLKYWPYHLISMWPWANHVDLCVLRFPYLSLEIIMTPSHKVAMRIQCVKNLWHVLNSVWHTIKITMATFESLLLLLLLFLFHFRNEETEA